MLFQTVESLLFPVKTILNPAPATQIYPEFFKNSDIFCPNESEVRQDLQYRLIQDQHVMLIFFTFQDMFVILMFYTKTKKAPCLVTLGVIFHAHWSMKILLVSFQDHGMSFICHKLFDTQSVTQQFASNGPLFETA